MNEERTWSTPEVQRLTGATDRQLHYWHKRRYLRADEHGGNRHAGFRWPFDAVLRARVLTVTRLARGGELRGLENPVIAAVAAADLTADFLLIAPEVRAVEPEEVPAIVHAHGGATVVPLGFMRAMLWARIADIP